MNHYDATSPLAIIAGEGALPHLILQARQNCDATTYVVAINGQTPTEITNQAEHGWFRIGAIGAMIEQLQTRNISQIVLAGKIARPNLRDIIPDSKGRELLKKLGMGLFGGGDNNLLATIINYLESQGLQVVGAHEICQAMVANAGTMGKYEPDETAIADLAIGKNLLIAISPYDVGQAVVLQMGSILGVEALEGTAALIERAGKLRHADSDSKPVLVKLPKLKQELRADMPSIGLQTIEAMAQGGFAGAFLANGQTLMLDKAKIIARADELGLFLHGVEL